MKKRSATFGTYNTAAHGWTLTSWSLSAPEQKTNYVEKSGGDGSWDLSTVLTDGIPRYKDRQLIATLECSEGTREDRERIINRMVNLLDGLEWQITPPDRPEYYLRGRVHVAVDYSDLAHAAVTITATCAPWLYRARETVVELTATPEPQTEILYNRGRLAAVPVMTLTGSVSLKYKETIIKLDAGSYEWPALLLTSGMHSLEYSGTGNITLVYREAVLR